jgi:hypothetical protein
MGSNRQETRLVVLLFKYAVSTSELRSVEQHFVVTKHDVLISCGNLAVTA